MDRLAGRRLERVALKLADGSLVDSQRDRPWLLLPPHTTFLLSWDEASGLLGRRQRVRHDNATRVLVGLLFPSALYRF